MTLDPATRLELERLLSVCCDEAPTEAEQARLNEMLRNDVACRGFYLRYMDMHAWLLQRPGGVLPTAATEPKLVVAPLNRLSAFFSGPVLRVHLWWILAAAAVLPTAAYFWLQATADRRAVVPAVVENSAPSTSTGAALNKKANQLATVVATEAAVWSDQVTREPGSRLESTLLELKSGRVGVQFDEGTRVTLYGPATLKLLNSHSALLLQGRGSFQSDNAAGAFELLTPQTRWVDENAIYDAVVTSEAEELHVVAGEIVRTALPESSETQPPLRLAKGQARRFLRAGDTVGTIIPFDTRWQPDPKPLGPEPVATNGLIAYESFEPKSLYKWRGAWTVNDPDSSTGEFRRTIGLRPAPTSESGDARLLLGRVSVSRLLPGPIRTDVDGVYFFSFLVRAGRMSPDGEPCDIQFSLRNSLDAEPRHKLSASLSWSKNSIAVGWEDGGRQVAVPLDVQGVYAVIGKISLSGKQPDQIFVRLFSGKQSLPSNEPADWTVVSLPVMSRSEFDTVQWTSANTYGIAVDELRIGSTWSAVVGPYESPVVVTSPEGKPVGDN